MSRGQGSVRDRATRLLAITEDYLAKVLSFKNEYLQEIAPYEVALTEIEGRKPPRPKNPSYECSLRIRQCADELQAALDEGAPEPMVAARLGALIDASAELRQGDA